jgi:hypothetical protein
MLGCVCSSKSNFRSVAQPPSPLNCTTHGFTCKITSTPSANVRVPFANIIINSIVEILTVIFWLTTWALLASESSGFVTSVPYGLSTIDVGSVLPSDLHWDTAINCTKAAAGLGALEWVLFVVTLVFFGTFPASFSPKSNFCADRFEYRHVRLQNPYRQCNGWCTSRGARVRGT